MRTYLIMLIFALAMTTSYGCSDKKSAGRTPDETAKLAASGGGASVGGGGNVSTPGMDDEATQKRIEEYKKRKGITPPDDAESDEASKDGEEASDEEASDDGEKKEEAKRTTPKRQPASAFGKKRKVKTPSMAGPNMDEMKKKRDEEAAKKLEEQQANSGLSGGLGNRPPRRDSEPAAEVKTPSFMERAEKAFAMKHDPEGFQYLYAHYLTENDALETHPLSWFKGINEPRVGLRWGVAINYSPGSFEGDPPKIGDAVAESTPRSGSGGNRRRGGNNDLGGGGAGGGSMGISGGRSKRNEDRRQRARDRGGLPGNSTDSSGRTPTEELVYYTGDFGETLIERYEMRRRHNEAFYGSIMEQIGTELEDDAPQNTAGNNQANQPRERSRPSDGGDFGTMGGATGGSDVDRARQRRNRQRSGLGSTRGGGSDSDSEYEADETALAPGMMFLGMGNKAQMLENAKKFNIDVLIVFDVKITHREQRNGDTNTKSNTKLTAYSVKSGKSLVDGTKSLSHKAVAAARKKGTDDDNDPVQMELDKLFADMADEQFKSAEFPELGDEKFVERFEFLVDKDYTNPLPVLVEIKHYLNADYITQNDYMSACEKLLGKVAAQDLIDGDMKKKEMALKPYLPGEYEVKVDSEGDNFR